MKITDALCGEHAVLYTLFDHLEQTLKNNYGSSVISEKHTIYSGVSYPSEEVVVK